MVGLRPEEDFSNGFIEIKHNLWLFCKCMVVWCHNLYHSIDHFYERTHNHRSPFCRVHHNSSLNTPCTSDLSTCKSDHSASR